ncbi:hypothetical protein EVG20_g7721 [Dentipellis fragilis]|uniref:Uncharacterized protein n=1 Tax=Dentipellis fragilis TaxID=205917 RepID=A0A4Y9YAP9_9AGAM|nr:hypothetical protein EVG20_g7721 [Dentipellis fragilis]
MPLRNIRTSPEDSDFRPLSPSSESPPSEPPPNAYLTTMVRDFFPTFLYRAAERRKLRENAARPGASTALTANKATCTRLKVADQETGYPDSTSEDVSFSLDADLSITESMTTSATDSSLHYSLRTPSPFPTSTRTRAEFQPFIFHPDQETTNPSHAFREDFSPIRPSPRHWQGPDAERVVAPKPMHPNQESQAFIDADPRATSVPALEPHGPHKEVPVQAALGCDEDAYDTERPTLGWETLDIRSLWNEPQEPPSTCMASLMEDDLVVYLQDR